MNDWPRARNRSGDLFDAGMTAYSRLWLMRTGVTDLVAAVIDAVEPLIRADERVSLRAAAIARIRADERGRFRESMELAEAEVRSHKDRWADLRGKVAALPTVGGVTMPYVKGAEHQYEMVYRDDVLALIGGSDDQG